MPKRETLNLTSREPEDLILLAPLIQRLYVEGYPRANVTDAEVEAWYSRAEDVAWSQARRFRAWSEDLDREDPLGVTDNADTERQTALAWQDLAEHVGAGCSTDEQANRDFWLLLTYKAVALRERIRLLYGGSVDRPIHEPDTDE